jgi:hypothetical protein
MDAEHFVQLLRQVNFGLGNVFVIGTVVHVVGVTFRDCDDDGAGCVPVLLTASKVVVHVQFPPKKKYPLLMRLSVAGYAAPLGLPTGDNLVVASSTSLHRAIAMA